MEPKFTDFDPMDDFERELREAMQRRPAPPGLKRKVMGKLWERAAGRQRRNTRMVWLERIAASLILAGVAASAALWHHEEQRRRAEEAKQQVMTALRIANHALEEVQEQLAEQDQDK